VYDRDVRELKRENRRTDDIRFTSGFWCLIVSNDPEKTFSEAANHIFYQANNYSEWLSAAGLSPLFPYLCDREQLEQSGLLKVVDPDTAISMIQNFSNKGRCRPDCRRGGRKRIWSWSPSKVIPAFS
jgi:hypothetical protein